MGGRGEDVVGDKVGGGLKDWRKGIFAGFGTLGKGTRGGGCWRRGETLSQSSSISLTCDHRRTKLDHIWL